jgi:hypothetical protein
MALATPSALPNPLPEAFLPQLENGARLMRDEFERRYSAMPKHVRAELIGGVVFMASPVRISFHGQPHAYLVTWAGLYRFATPGIIIGDNSTIRLDADSEPQPDLCLFIDPARGGKAKIAGDGYVGGAPEFVAQVAASSVDRDLGPKLEAYQRNGVDEYLVWRVQDGAIDWFILREGRFDRLLPDADGISRSIAFPGLWLDSAAVLAGDLARVHAVLQDGLADPSHAVFAAKLSAMRAAQ